MRDKGTFIAVTLTVSFFLYGIAGYWIASREPSGTSMAEENLMFWVGGGAGLIASAIYDIFAATEYGVKDYIFSIGTLFAIIAFGYIFIMLLFISAVLGMLLGTSTEDSCQCCQCRDRW